MSARKLRIEAGYITVKEAAEKLEVNQNNLTYWIHQNLVEAPTRKICEKSKRKYYSKADIRRLKKQIDTRKDKKNCE